MKKLLLLLILSFFSAQGYAGSCPDGSEPVKTLSDDGTYFVYKCNADSNKTNKIVYSKNEQILHGLYQKVREIRSNKAFDIKEIKHILKDVKKNYNREWLILLELYELVYKKDITLEEDIHSYLIDLQKNKDLIQLISDGFSLIKK